MAVGNPLVKKRVEAANELSRYLALQRKAVETHVRLEKELMELPARINHQAEVIEKCKLDIEHYHNNYREIDKEERKAIRGALFAAVKSNILMPTERVAMTYKGFDIVLPVNMTVEKPFIWLQKNGRYYVELADTELGMLVRIDNYLDKLEEHLEKMQTSLSDMYARKSAAKAELSQKENYTDKIEEIKAQLERLDKKLGVNKK